MVRFKNSAAMRGLRLPSLMSNEGTGEQCRVEVAGPQVEVGDDGVALVDGWAQAKWHDWIET